MITAHRCRLVLVLAWLCFGAAGASQPLEYVTQEIEIDGRSRTVSVPHGFVLELLVTGLGGPRMIGVGPAGELLIGSKSGFIYSLLPPYIEAQVLTRVRGYPHSVAVRDGELLVARTDGVYALPYADGEPIELDQARVLGRLPRRGGHSSRTVGVGPDGRVYVSIGISSNCSDEYLGEQYPFERRRGGVLVLDESSEPPRWRPFASGLRNPVGFDWHPESGELYASNNGPDHLGFEEPPEYFSRLTPGSFHGMPWYQQVDSRIQRDACIGSEPPRPIDEVQAPLATFPARNAPMGVAFVPAGALDERLQGDAIVALRGSWGTLPSGSGSGDPATRRHPKVVVVRFSNGQPTSVEDLVTGFQLEDGERWARPVGVRIGPDGALYFTSDTGVNGLFRLRRVE